jgi:recombination protein RecA
MLEKLLKEFKSVLPERGQIPDPVSYLPTGILPLDWALGGGFPRGHISVVWGPEGSGKSSLMINPIINAQLDPVYNGETLYFALEPKLNMGLFSRMGVDMSKVMVSKTLSKDEPLTGVKVFNMIRKFVGEVDFIVVDSVPCLAPSKLYDDDEDSANFGAIAKLLSNQLPLVANMLAATKTSIVMINQTRSNIGAQYITDKQFGGHAIRFYPAIILKLRRGGKPIKRGRERIGFESYATVEKNSLGRERLEATWNVYYDEGIDFANAAYEQAKIMGILNTHSGKIGDLSLCHPGVRASREDAVARMREEPDLFNQVVDLVMAASLTDIEIVDAPPEDEHDIDLDSDEE